MRKRAKQIGLVGLDRVLSASGVDGPELMLARAETVGWARNRARVARTRRLIVTGVGIVVTRPGRAELRPIEVLTAGAGEVTIELLATAISPGTERAQWLRLPNAQPSLPFWPGYSGAGRVVAAGRDVDIEVGALVAVARARHASVMTVPAAWATPVPPGVRVQDAALVYLAIIAGYGLLRIGGRASDDAPLCVIGAGPIGALAQRLAAVQAWGPVVVVASSRRREAAALGTGAARFLTLDDDPRQIAAAAVVEATGNPAALSVAVAAARPGATIVLLGSPRGVTRAFPLAEFRRKGLRLVGAHISALATEAKRATTDPFDALARAYIEALEDGRLDSSDLAGEPADPREIVRLYRRLAGGEVHGAHLDWTRLPREERISRRPALLPPSLRPSVSTLAVDVVAPPGGGGAKLRFAVVGCGDIGLTNARAITAASNAEVSLCHDADRSLAVAAAARCGGAVADTLEDVFESARADAVFLSVPHDLHAPLALRAARAGLHVVVEKPLATNLAAAREAVEAAAAARVALSVCLSFRYYATVRTVRRLVEEGALGAVRGAAVIFHADKPQSYWLSGFSGRAPSNWRASRSRAGGGVLIMNLVHYVDLIRHIAGIEPIWVAGTARTDDGAEVEDAVALSVGFGGGAIGSLCASASTRGSPPNRFELWGADGTVRLEPDPAVYTERALDGVRTGAWTRIEDDESDERRIFVERFADAVLAGRPPEVPPVDGFAAQSFVDAAYRAIEQGRPVTIDPVPPRTS